MKRGAKPFNFRDVLHRIGIADDDKRINWAVGKLLRDAAMQRGLAVDRPLTAKTNQSASVGAPHCIAAYPPDFFDEAVGIIRDWWGDRTAQHDLFQWLDATQAGEGCE